MTYVKKSLGYEDIKLTMLHTMYHYKWNNVPTTSMISAVYIPTLRSVKKQVQLHFSCTAVSSEDSSATDLLILQTQYKVLLKALWYALSFVWVMIKLRNSYSNFHMPFYFVLLKFMIAQWSRASEGMKCFVHEPNDTSSNPGHVKLRVLNPCIYVRFEPNACDNTNVDILV